MHFWANMQHLNNKKRLEKNLAVLSCLSAIYSASVVKLFTAPNASVIVPKLE